MSNIEVFSGLVEKNGVKMMSSKSICALLNDTRELEQNPVTHLNTLRDIRNMLLNLDESVLSDSFVIVKDARGYDSEIFLDEDLSLCLVSGKRVKVRLAIIKAFAEAKKKIESLTHPLTVDSAMALANQAYAALLVERDAKELALAQAAASGAQLESLEKTHVKLSVSAACKQLGFRPVKTMAYMRDAGYFTKLNQPCSTLCGRGFFEVCSVQVSETRYEQQTRVTGEGLVWMDSILRRGLPAECFESLKKEVEQLKKEAVRKKDRDIGYENKRGDHRVLI